MAKKKEKLNVKCFLWPSREPVPEGWKIPESRMDMAWEILYGEGAEQKEKPTQPASK
ncbi:hypothetical protein PSS96_002460 [Enterococcus faecium]|nr:hypothetical protein [Enterococcus faecium]EME7094183.1 hypothetical protein [Enterococcus faecium]EME7139553.1 hypothetical protein [Enterococcus faecium]